MLVVLVFAWKQFRNKFGNITSQMKSQTRPVGKAMGSKWMRMEFVSHLLQDAGYEMLDEAIREVNNKATKWHATGSLQDGSCGQDIVL